MYLSQNKKLLKQTKNKLSHKNKKWSLDPSKCLTTAQVKKVFKIADERKNQHKRSTLIEYVVVITLFLTGMRRSELADLRWKNIIFDEQEPHIFIERGKSERSRRIIPLNPYLINAIFQYIKGLAKFDKSMGFPPPDDYFLKTPSGKRYTGYGVYLAFKRVMDETDIKHKNPHIARHTFAVDLYKRSEYNLRLVQNTLGHSSIKITEMYTHVSLHKVKIACDKLYEEVLDD